jgi:aminoacrylate hydrolase
MDVELSRIEAVMGHDLRARLPQINVPTLCIGAQDDQITPPGFTEEMAAAIPGAELHLLPRGGHFCPTSETSAYNARIMDFLTR